MKYRLKQNTFNSHSDAVMEEYLTLLGVVNTDSFLHQPSAEDELDPLLLKNMDICIERLHEACASGKKMFLQVDSDVDGYTSASIFYNYFTKMYSTTNIVFRLHEGKEHGVILETVPHDCDYIILPDSGSMQLSEQKSLSDLGKTVIILDHHEVTDSYVNEKVIVVNNQDSPLFANPCLSGAGVVFKTIQAHNQKYFPNDLYYKHFYDLAALGILSDVMDSKNLDNNFIIFHGLNNINNLMFQALINKQAFSIKDVEDITKIETVFYIAPLINGVIRMGEMEDKNNLFLGFIERPLTETVVTTYRGIERNEEFYDFVARNSINVKNRQASTKEKAVNLIQEKIEAEHLDNNKVLVVALNEKESSNIPKTLTGLIAMELVKIYGKPAILLRAHGAESYAGSGRGLKADGFTSLLETVQNTKKVDYAEGHAMAFGVQVPTEKLLAFIDDLNNSLSDIDFTINTMEIDAIFTDSYINAACLYDIATHTKIFGNGIPEPKIAFELTIPASRINAIGKDGSTLRFNYDNITFIKFKDLMLLESLPGQGLIAISLIGRPSINEYMGKRNLQIMIEDLEAKPISNKLF